MKSRGHYLMIQTEDYQAIDNNEKKFEIRKNDRDFREGDKICFQEVVGETKTGRSMLRFKIKYILYGGDFGLDPDYCIFNW